MTWATTLFLLLFLLPLIGIVLAVQLRPRALAASVERLARRVNLALDDEIRAEVALFQRRRLLASGVGSALGVVTAFALSPADSPVRSSAIVLGVFGGVAVGVGLAALLHARRASRASAPVAGRLTPIEIDDLVPASERRGMRIAVIVAAGIVLTTNGVLALVDELGAVDPLVTVATTGFLGLAVIGVGAWEGAAPRIARLRPVGGGQQALAWSDALRSLTLRDMVTAPLTAALYAPLTLLGELVSRADGLLGAIAGAALGAVAIAFAVAVIVMGVVDSAPGSRRNPAQHYQRRLWPELANGGSR